MKFTGNVKKKLNGVKSQRKGAWLLSQTSESEHEKEKPAETMTMWLK